MTYSPIEDGLPSHWCVYSPPPVNDMPSPDCRSSPGYSVTTPASPSYTEGDGRDSPVHQTVESPPTEVKKEIYASNWKDYVENLPRLPSRPRALTPTGFRENDTQQKRDVTSILQRSSWFKIPPNLRRDILLLAFGGRRLHMCLKCDADPPNAWHSFGMVCRHVPAGEKGPMTRGWLQGPWSDECDSPQEDADPGGDLESVGVMGWLLSCRQNYAETIDILYSKNTILMYDEPLLTYVDQLILPHRASLITSLEVKWYLKPQGHNETLFDLLALPRFPNLKRLYISLQMNSDYNPTWLDKTCSCMDELIKARPGLIECAVAIPHRVFEDGAYDNIQMKDGWKRGTYSQLWYSVDRTGGPEAIRLPYVDSYPHPPFQLGPNPGAGWWLLEGTDAPLSWRWASSPIFYDSPGWQDWSGYD